VHVVCGTEKAAARIYGPHEQTEANPAQPARKAGNKCRRTPSTSADRPVWGKPVRGGPSELRKRRNAHGRKKPSSYTSSTSLIISASATSATACTTKDLACWCELDEPWSRRRAAADRETHGRSSARGFSQTQTECADVAPPVERYSRLPRNSSSMQGGWQAMKACARVLKSGPRSQAK